MLECVITGGLGTRAGEGVVVFNQGWFHKILFCNYTISNVLLPFGSSCPLHFRVNNVGKRVNLISLKQSRKKTESRQLSLISELSPHVNASDGKLYRAWEQG